MQKPRLTSVFQIVRHSTYFTPRAEKGRLTLPGVGIAYRTGEIAGENFVKHAGDFMERGVSVKVITSPTVRTRESAQEFLKTFLATPFGKNRRLASVTTVKRPSSTSKLKEYERLTDEVKAILKRGNAGKINELRKKWEDGEYSGLEPKEKVEARHQFILDLICKKRAESKNATPKASVDFYHISMHGWILENLLEKISGKHYSKIGGPFQTGEGFQVFVYNNGKITVSTIRRQENKIRHLNIV